MKKIHYISPLRFTPETLETCYFDMRINLAGDSYIFFGLYPSKEDRPFMSYSEVMNLNSITCQQALGSNGVSGTRRVFKKPLNFVNALNKQISQRVIF